jgi:hypothetical protein
MRHGEVAQKRLRLTLVRDQAVVGSNAGDFKPVYRWRY